MATKDLHKLTVQEAVNAMGPGGIWDVNSAENTGSNADVTNTVHLTVSGATQLGVYSAGDIYFNFSESETDCNTSNDMVLPGNTLLFLTVPKGLGNTIYFNHLSTSTTTHSVRTVEI